MDETDGSLPYHVYQSKDYFLHDAIQNHHDAMHPSLFSIMTSRQLNQNKSSCAGSISSSKTSLHARSTSKRSPSRSPGSATVRRMPNEDVRAIFESLHQHGPLPAHLEFKVVMGVLNGKRLSPPPFEYEGTTMYQLFSPCYLFCFFVHVNISYVFWAASHTLSLVRYKKNTDGLYVLLKPPKKKKHQGDPTLVPSHLADLVMPVPAETCPWQLSGPQFPRPTAIQQRYCYPRW
jgi:hypothetical protein